MLRTLAAMLVLSVSCADPPAREAGPPNAVPNDVPDVAEIVCEADGSTIVRTPQVLVQPDGVHVHVVSRLDEPAQIVGLGNDVDSGETDYVTPHVAPGPVGVACYPFSLHETLQDPPTEPIEILDPSGFYVDGEVQCSGTISSMIGDFAEPPIEGMRVPLETARAAIRGLDNDDQVFHVGYPEQPDPSVAVRRDGQLVATFSVVTFDGYEWVIASSSICGSSGLG
jgi:hypothetical protein